MAASEVGDLAQSKREQRRRAKSRLEAHEKWEREKPQREIAIDKLIKEYHDKTRQNT